MGRLLQIRVMARTFDENEVRDAWPKLSELAWGKVLPEQGQGVLELASTLEDKLRMGMLPPGVAAEEAAIKAAGALVRSLERALGDWKPGDAERLSNQLEDALTDLEKKIKKV
jgi:hypothetical protein